VSKAVDKSLICLLLRPPTQAASVDKARTLKVVIIIPENSLVPERTAEQTRGIVLEVSSKPMAQEMPELTVSVVALSMPSSPPTNSLHHAAAGGPFALGSTLTVPGRSDVRAKPKRA
jgi:hypothetical protein